MIAVFGQLQSVLMKEDKVKQFNFKDLSNTDLLAFKHVIILGLENNVPIFVNVCKLSN